MIQLDNATVYWGSNLDVLPSLPDNSVDSIVTDPPYEIGFMGKSWDSSGIAYSVELWTECMRVLKPGGHLLAFGGSRTWHRLAVAIEDAGFEMRDSIAWLYGSGFPKSMDISKAIDKRGGQGATLTKQIGEALREAREKRGISKTQADQLFCDGSTNWTWFEGRPAGQRPPTPETFARIIAEWQELAPLAELVAEAEREVIGVGAAHCKQLEEVGVCDGHFDNGTLTVKHQLATAPATPEAIKWQGWGTALKPAFEPVVVARKPFKGTVAGNVLEWGVGGLNIDGSRIGLETIPQYQRTVIGGKALGGKGVGIPQKTNGITTFTTGRWPANIILDPYTAELLDEQSGDRPGGTFPAKRGQSVNTSFASGQETVGGQRSMGDSGGASRFFYVAKASKRDRNEGLEELPVASAAEMVDREEGSAGMNSPRAGAGRTSGSANIHPTVKPTSLMEYLIKLVTPEGGTVLDPFTGSGSTGKAALLNGFQFIGIELTEEYLPIIEGRLKWANEQRTKQDSQSAQEEKETLF
jgi:DNA modification methylase